MTGKISEDPAATTLVGLEYAAIQGGANVRVPQTLLDAEVSNNADVAANTAARHAAVTVTDSTEIDFTLTGQDLTASLKSGAIDESKLDASVNASLDLADSALQPAAIGSTVQAYDADLAAIAGLSRTRGDLIRGGASAWERVALGTSGYALKSDGTDAVWSAAREVLTANRTYYVRTDGSDSNTGLADTSGGAFLTIAKAISVVAALDLSIYNVTISCQTGVTWNVSLTFSGKKVGTGTVTLQGNGGTLNSTTCVTAQSGAEVTVSGFTLVASVTGLNALTGGVITFGSSVVFGACSSYHIWANGGTIYGPSAVYSITGAASRHAYALGSLSYIELFAATVTLSGTLGFSQFVAAARGGFINANSSTWTGGTITGQRYNADTYGLINTSGGGASFFPGNSAGTDNSGAGKYV